MSDLLAEAFRHCCDSSAAAGGPGDVDEATQLDDIEREFKNQHGAQLPVRAVASEALLIENTLGRWQTWLRFGLTIHPRMMPNHPDVRGKDKCRVLLLLLY